MLDLDLEEQVSRGASGRPDLALARQTSPEVKTLAEQIKGAQDPEIQMMSGWLQAWGAPGDGANFRLTVPEKAHGAMTRSPLPLEPEDAGPRVQSSPTQPYRSPRRDEVAR